MTAAPAAPAGPAGAPPQPPSLPPVPHELGQALAGVYYSAELDATYRIDFASDSTTIAVGNNSPVPLRLAGPDRLLASVGFLEFVPLRDESGRITSLRLNAGRVRDIVFSRR